MGSVSTSSPTSPITGWPDWSNASTRGAQARARDHPGPNRQDGTRPDEPGAQVGAPRKRTEYQILRPRYQLLVYPPETFRWQRRAGGADPAHGGKVMLGGRPESFLHAGQQVRRAGAGIGHARLRDQPPQGPGVRMHRAAVVEHDGRADQQPADEVVPHHPAGRGVPEERVRAGQILVQGQRLEVLEDDPAVAVHDRLREPRRPRRIQNPQWMGKGDFDELEFRRLAAGRDRTRPSSARGAGSARPRPDSPLAPR